MVHAPTSSSQPSAFLRALNHYEHLLSSPIHSNFHNLENNFYSRRKKAFLLK